MMPSATSSSVPHSASQLSDFLLRLCHDLRTPLRAIRAHAELMRREAPAESAVPRPVDFVMDGADQAVLLIDGLTEYSLALQINPAEFQRVSLGMIVRSVLLKLADGLRETDASVSYDTLPVVLGNPDRLMRLFENLLDNALANRGADRPNIRITAESRGEAWLIQIWDNGPGVDAEFLERMFKPFERIHGKERPGPALATCQVIVERHGGCIWAETNPSKVCFTLPAE